jgi:cell division protein FtsW
MVNFVSGEDDAAGSFQKNQAKIAIGTSGIFGKGPNDSTQKEFLPHPYSDFIYAIVIEEYGLLGGTFLLVLYLTFLFRCIKIVVGSPKAFGALLAVGLSVSLVIQALLNMAVTVGLLPVTGLPLPMVSWGGTSIWFTSISIGLILSVSRSIEKRDQSTAKKLVQNG